MANQSVAAIERLLEEQTQLAAIYRELCRILVYGDQSERRRAQQRVRRILDSQGQLQIDVLGQGYSTSCADCGKLGVATGHIGCPLLGLTTNGERR